MEFHNMKQIKIFKNGIITNKSKFETQAEADNWLASHVAKNTFGLPERLVPQADCTEEQLASALELIPEVNQIIPAQDAIELLDENGQSFDPPQFSEAIPERVEVISPAMARLPAEYTIEIENLEENPQWLLEQAIQKRRLEYPSAEEFLNAFFDGGDEALEALKNKRLEIKAKYPKP